MGLVSRAPWTQHAACVAGEEAPVAAMEHDDMQLSRLCRQYVNAVERRGRLPSESPGDKDRMMDVMPTL